MEHLKKKYQVSNFNFIKIAKISFSINRLKIIDTNSSYNLDNFIFLNTCSNDIDKLINKLKKNIDNSQTIIPPIYNNRIKTSSYAVKKRNQTKYINLQNPIEKPKLGDICDCEFFVDNIYSYSDNPDIFRFKIKINTIEVIN